MDSGSSRKRDPMPTKRLVRTAKYENYAHVHDANAAAAANASFLLTDSGFPSMEKKERVEAEAADSSSTLTTEELFMVCKHIKFLEEQQSASLSLIQSLRAELDVSHARVQELEMEQRLCRKDMEHVLSRYSQEKQAWRSREQERMNDMVQSLREQLQVERRARRKAESASSKLESQLQDLRQEHLQLVRDLEQERQTRQVLEQVCDELAREVGEDRARAEQLMRDSARFREEMEEERRMLHTAEILREERIHMKLEAARLFMEDKASALDHLKARLQQFLDSATPLANSSSSDSAMAVVQAQTLHEAVDSLKIHDMLLLLQLPSAQQSPASPHDAFSLEGDLNSMNVLNQSRKKNPFAHSFNGSSGSCNRNISPPLDCFEGAVSNNLDGHVEWNSSSEISSTSSSFGDEEEAAAAAEDNKQKPQHQHQQNEEEGANEFDGAAVADEIHARSESAAADDDDNHDDAKASTVLSSSRAKLPLVAKMQGHARKDDPLIAYPWRASPEKRVVTTKACRSPSPSKNFSSPHRTSPLCGLITPCKPAALKTPQQQQQRDNVSGGNPHISRGMKGFVEWPKGIRQNSLQARLLEARMENQKIQPPKNMKSKSRPLVSTLRASSLEDIMYVNGN